MSQEIHDDCKLGDFQDLEEDKREDKWALAEPEQNQRPILQLQHRNASKMEAHETTKVGGTLKQHSGP